MTGISAILHNMGISVSNDALLDTDKHLIIENDKKISKNVLTLKLNSIFDMKGKLTENESVECLLKTEDGREFAFIGTVKTRGKQTTVIHNLLKSERYNEILTKIKTWQTLQTFPAG